MEMAKYEIYQAFHNLNDKSFKVRTHADAVKDTIYRGVFRQDLMDQGFSNKDLKKAIRKNWIEERQIAINGSRRNVVIWLDQEMTSPTWHKRLIQKFRNYFKELAKSFRN